MSPRLALRFLGTPQIHLENELITLERRKALALLAYLALEQGEHSRESLSALLWPDTSQSNAFKNLRQILWELQKTIGEGWLMTDREKVGLSGSVENVWLDIREFESLLAESRTQDDTQLRISLLGDAAKLYRNHFMTGFSLKDAHPFNDWAFAEGEDLRHKFSVVLNRLAEDTCVIGQAAQAIPYARRLVALDPLNETAHRRLMEVYLQAGQQSAALKQYQTCEQILRKELNLDPQPETRELYKRIRKGQAKPIPVETRIETIIPGHNLPHQLSTFIGREKEQNEIVHLLMKKRLVTLAGAGGIGKTRLALKVGEQVLSHFPQGVWLIELASLNDPALVPQAVSAVFGIVERSTDTLSKRLIPFLKSKTALLILDNCEHLIDACAELAETLLQNCPHLKILATSREALGLAGEVIFYVPSLSMPNAKQVDRVAEYEAVRLFADRARLSVSSFSLTTENSPIVATICRRLEGIPLAIELAAARTNALSMEQIAARLDESFHLLTSNLRTKLARQQTLRASIEWSWNLLSDDERVLLRRLSVFAGGWTLEAAESVCSGESIEPQQVLDLLTQLVMKSMVVADRESAGEKRYRLLEMIRQYAREKLVESDEEETISKLHLAYFFQLSKKIERGLVGPEQAEWFTRVSQEIDNLRTALGYASRTNHVEAGLYMSSRLYRFWQSFNMREAADWLTEFIQRPESRDYPSARAKALCIYGWLLVWLQKFKQAYPFAQESLDLFRACENKRGEVDALLLVGNIIDFMGNFAQAIELYKQSLALAQSIGYSSSQARAHFYLGYDRRNIERSFDHLEKAANLLRDAGDWAALANTLGVLGTFRIWNGEVDLAPKYLDEATELWRHNRKVDIWENAKMAKSLIARLRGDYELASTLLQETLLVAEETGNRMSYLWISAHLGQLALRTGNLPEARRILAETMQGFQKDGHTIGTVFALEGMSSLFVMRGKPKPAARLIGFADATRERIPDVRPLIEQADIDRNIAAIMTKIGSSEFEVAYDEGRSMTFDEVVAYALGEN